MSVATSPTTLTLLQIVVMFNTTKLRPTMATRGEPFLFSPATWYLFSMIGFFFLTALLHGCEFQALLHGIWYLLCLPSGYLLLTIYSVANLTDRSWGKRVLPSMAEIIILYISVSYV